VAFEKENVVNRRQ